LFIFLNNSAMTEYYTLSLHDALPIFGPSLLASKCLNYLAETKGKILNITSSHGIKVYPEISAYGSAKAGLNMLTKIWALELAPLDRKSTRLNSSHVKISYAVFCLKKK